MSIQFTRVHACMRACIDLLMRRPNKIISHMYRITARHTFNNIKTLDIRYFFPTKLYAEYTNDDYFDIRFAVIVVFDDHC